MAVKVCVKLTQKSSEQNTSPKGEAPTQGKVKPGMKR